MGSGSSAAGGVGGTTALALVKQPIRQLDNKKSSTSLTSTNRWKSLKKHQLAHKAAFNMKKISQAGDGENIFIYQRVSREPWEQRLREAKQAVDIEAGSLGVVPEFDESATDLRSLMLGSQLVEDVQGRLNTGEVRVYLSSNFRDCQIERQLLADDVYLYLRQFCQRLGLNLHVVDPHWGVPNDQLDLDRGWMIDEVKRCSASSVGPFLVCLVGHKYGYRGVPTAIKQPVFQRILDHLENQPSKDGEDERAISLIRDWYILDLNVKEPEYVLRPVSDKFGKAQVQEWLAESGCMRAALARAIRDTNVEHSVAQRFFASQTENEFLTAIEEMRLSSQVMCFVKSVPALRESDKNSETQMDSINGKLDWESDQRLLRLKTRMEQERLIRARYHLKWNKKDGCIDLKGSQIELQRMSDQFCELIMNSVVKTVLSLSTYYPDDPLYTEVLQHVLMCGKNCQTFCGREQCLNRIEEYLENNHRGKLLIVHGVPGIGKTSLMSKAYADSIASWEVPSERPVHIIRFIGLTPESATITNLLKSLCQQIMFCYELDHHLVPQTFKGLCSCLIDLLAKSHAEKPLVIFLDGLNQLTDQNDARFLRWLPSHLPKYTHLIVSTNPAAGLVTNLKAMIQTRDNFLEIPPLNDPEVVSITKQIMKRAERTLTPLQMGRIRNACSQNPSTALYLKLLCHEALEWKSFTPMSECKIESNSAGMITLLFQKLERIFGQVVVKQCMCFITVAKKGLGCSELLDILSCDDLALDEVFKDSAPPPTRRFPPAVWAKLRHRLSEYLTEVVSDGILVYRWRHMLFGEVARLRYLADSQHAVNVHRSMADYFSGRWAQVLKPYRDRVTKETRLVDRLILSQPLTIVLDPTKKEKEFRYNLRVLSELPCHLIRAKMWNEASNIMGSYTWLEAKIKTGRAYELCHELHEAFVACDQGQVLNGVYCFVRDNLLQLQKYPELLCQQALNQPDSSHLYKVAQQHIKERPGQMMCLVDKAKDQMLSPDVTTLKFSALVHLCVLSEPLKYLAAYTDNKLLTVWKVSTLEIVMRVKCDTDILSMVFSTGKSSDGHNSKQGSSAEKQHQHSDYLVVVEQQEVKIYPLNSSVQLKGINQGNIQELSSYLSKSTEVYLDQSQKSLHLLSFSYLTTFNLRTGKPMKKRDLGMVPHVAKFSHDGSLIIILDDTGVYLWGFNREGITKTFNVTREEFIDEEEKDDSVSDDLSNATVAFSLDGKQAVAVLPEATFVWSIAGSNRKPVRVIDQTCLSSPWTTFSPDLAFIATPDGRDLSLLCMQRSPFSLGLEGHTKEVTCCSYASFHKKAFLMATGSRDHSIKLWQTTHLTPYGANFLPFHHGPVSVCVYSNTRTKALSSCEGYKGYWLWDLSRTPPYVSCELALPELSQWSREVCFSNDDSLVANCFSVEKTCGVNIWNISKASIFMEDVETLHPIQRILPFENTSNLFADFYDNNLFVCFQSTASPGTMLFVEVASNSILADWKKDDSVKPNFFRSAFNPLEFIQGAACQVLMAGMAGMGEGQQGRQCLAAISVPIAAYLKSREDGKHLLVEAAPKVTLWNLETCEQLCACALPVDVGRHHRLAFCQNQLVVSWQQCRKNRSLVDGGQSAWSLQVFAINPASGKVMERHGESGQYSHISQVNGGGGGGGAGAVRGSGPFSGWLASGVMGDGAFHCREIRSGRQVVKFMDQQQKITVFNFANDRKSVMLGCAGGKVYFLQLICDI